MLKDGKGLSPVVKIPHAFYYAGEEEKGCTWKKNAVSCYRCVEIAQVSVGSPGNYQLGALLPCSSPSNSSESSQGTKQDLTNSVYFARLMSMYLQYILLFVNSKT